MLRTIEKIALGYRIKANTFQVDFYVNTHFHLSYKQTQTYRACTITPILFVDVFLLVLLSLFVFSTFSRSVLIFKQASPPRKKPHSEVIFVTCITSSASVIFFSTWEKKFQSCKRRIKQIVSI